MNEIHQDTLESHLDWTVQAELGGERSDCLVTVQPKTQYIKAFHRDGLSMDMKCDCVFSCASACVSLQQHSQYCQWFKTEYLMNRDNNVALRTSEDCSEM